MTPDQIITAAPIPMTISDGASSQELNAAPLTVKDFAELTGWVQHQIIKTAKDSLNGMLPMERDEILQAAIKAAAGSTWDSRNGRQITSSVEGLIHIGWMMIRRQHKTTKENFHELMYKDLFKNIMEVDRAFWELNFPTAAEETTKEEVKDGEPISQKK